MRPLLHGAFAALAAFAFADAAAAQTQANPVVEHYRAYRAAMDSGDLVAAEAEAQAAFEASAVRNGNGGNTGALAVNLAQARLSLGRRADAYEPAMRAFAIVNAGASNLDPELVRLVLGRAELTDDRWREGRKRLEAALEEARANPALNADTYTTAADLGQWLFTQKQYRSAARAWAIALEMADAAGVGNDHARAESRMAHAASLFADVMEDTIREQGRPTDTRLAVDPFEAFDEADRELVEAQNILGPYVFTQTPNGELTLAQRVFASALAWRALLRAFGDSRGFRPLAQRGPDFEPPQTDSRPLCHVEAVAEPLPNFPPAAAQSFMPGAAVVRFSIGETGQVSDSRVAAAMPEQWFHDAVSRVAPRWTIRLSPDSPPDCRYQTIMFIPITFVFR